MARRARTCRLRLDRRAAAAVEFAIVALPFTITLLAVLGAGVSFFRQQSLDYAVQIAARQVQIGNVPPGTTAAAFVQNTLCPVLGLLQSCSNISVDLHPVSDYQQLAAAGSPDAPGSAGSGGFVFCAGQPGQLMYAHVVQLVPALGGLLTGSAPGGLEPLIGNAAFANENPAGATVAPGAGC